MRRLWLAVATAVLVASHAAASPPRPNVVLVTSDDQRWDLVGAAGNRAVVTPALDRLAREGLYFTQATVTAPQCVRSRATLVTGLMPHQLRWDFAEAGASGGAGAPARVPMLPALLRDAGYQTVLVGKWHLPFPPTTAGFTDVRTWMGGVGAYLDAPELQQGPDGTHVTGHGFTNEIFGDDAVAFLESPAAKRQPFLLWLALTAPHEPRRPNPPDIVKLYAGKSDRDLWPPGLPLDAKPRELDAYYEAVSMADRQVGRVLAALDRSELARGTLVVFLSDNGALLGARDDETPQHNDVQGKILPYEGSIRVPLMLRGPHVGRAAVDAQPVSSLDVPPTILAAAGLPVPAAWPGRDLTKPAKTRETFSEFSSAKVEYRSVRTPSHKLVVWQRPQKKPELYDLAHDPHERKNLVDDAAAAPERRDLLHRLRAWLEKTADPAREWVPADDAGLR